MKIICSPNGIVDEKSPRTGWIEIERAGFTDSLSDVLILPLQHDGVVRGQEWEVNKAFFMSQYEQMKPQGDGECSKQILLQTTCREISGHMVRWMGSDAGVLGKWVDALNELVGEAVFGICIDTGTLNLCGYNMYEYIHTLGDRIKAVVLRENDGVHDVAMLPFTSVTNGYTQMDWLGVIRGLRKIGFDGYLIMDFGDTASAFSPLLRPQLMSMAKSIADYFKWQIEIENLLKKHKSIVLFGAGAMCCNYMKNYGEKYPPLFTCDNNKALWGTYVLGLEVKSPECLMDLPKDCAIFICNRYYREIEVQLREMGVENTIEYFNDEYMPTFYLKSIES